ncbi:MAG: hypothetical protein M1813_008955 [Trichoglossum hirsutum]|jgi:hypothetical protein|nr:MAG: hypothetical protein M1813_008955 [Trichoglossum hirsutum]
MTEYSRLLHASSSESETPTAAPGGILTPNGKFTVNSSKKKRLQRPESLVPTARINYLQSPVLIERGDWVVRLRDGDLMSMAKLDENDIWDGPFPVIELPPATGDETDDVNVTASPVKEIPRVKLRFPSGSKGDPWTSVNRLIPVYPDPPRPDGDATGSVGVTFHLRKGSSTFVELQRSRPRSKKEKELYIVGRLRDRRLMSKDAEPEYLVHWAGWPSEDDSWEKMDGIPESFHEEYEKAKSGKKADARSKTPKTKTDTLSTTGRGPSTSVVVKDEAPETGRETSPLAAVAKVTVPTARKASARKGASSDDPQAATTSRDISSRGRGATLAEPSITTGSSTQTQPKPPTPKRTSRTQKQATPVPVTPVTSRVLGKRNGYTHSAQQTSPEEVMTGKRRRVASAKKRASMT